MPPVYDDDNEKTGNDSRASTREVDEDQSRSNHENSEAMIFGNESISSSLEVTQNSIHSISTTPSFENNVSFHDEQDSVFVESSNKKPKLEPFDGNLQRGVFGVLDEGEDYIEEIPDQENVDVKIDCDQFVQKLEMKELSTVVSAFHTLVKSLYIDEIGDFLEKIELKMEQIGIQLVSINTIKLAYEACINIVERRASTEVKPHGSYNVRDFFINIRHNLVSIRSDSMEEIIKKLTKDIENFQIVHQRVTIETLISAMEVALTILTA